MICNWLRQIDRDDGKGITSSRGNATVLVSWSAISLLKVRISLEWQGSLVFAPLVLSALGVATGQRAREATVRYSN